MTCALWQNVQLNDAASTVPMSARRLQRRADIGSMADMYLAFVSKDPVT